MELVNFKCPNCSGSVTFEEEKDVAICNFCGAELHFQQEIEKIHEENKNELESVSNRIIDLIEERNFLQAENAIKDALLKYPYAGRLHVYMLMCEYAVDYPEKLTQLGKDFTTSANYKKCVRYLLQDDKQDLMKLVERMKENGVTNSIVQPTAAPSKNANEEKQSEEEDGSNEESVRKIEEILADESLTSEQKVYELLEDKEEGGYFNYADLLLDHADNLDWYINYELPENCRKEFFGDIEPDPYLGSEIDCWLSGIMQEGAGERLDAFCSEMEKIDAEKIAKDKGLARLNRVYQIWKNRPIGGVVKESKYEDQSLYLKDFRLYFLGLYKYIAEMFIAEEIYIETFSEGYVPKHFVNIQQQYQTISRFKAKINYNDDFYEAPSNFVSENWDSGTMKKILEKELKFIETNIYSEYEKAVLNYELGGLGLFAGSRKKEIKEKLANNEKELVLLNADVDIAVLEGKKALMLAFLDDLEKNKKPLVDEAKAKFDATPITAFGRRKELKEEYRRLNDDYVFQKGDFEGKIKTYETELAKVKKTAGIK